MNELYILSSLLEGRRERLHLYIYRHGLPVLDLGLETAAVDDRFGQGKPVQTICTLRGSGAEWI